MTFITTPDNATRRIIPPAGPRTAKIAIVGEAGGAYENIQLKPFVGPAGSVLEQCLHAAGLIRSECYITNVVKWQPKGNNIEPYFNGAKGTFTQLGMESVLQLREELDETECNVLVACGATAFAALTGLSKILKYRGYFFPSIGLARPRKVLPTIHPAASLRGMYLYRHIISADLKKARMHSDSPELKRPERTLVYQFGGVGEVLEWLEYYEKQERICLDIEVMNYEMSCIGFSSDPGIALSIPLDDRWTELEELQIWRGIQRVLSSPSIKVGQNLIFDLQFLLQRYGFIVQGHIEDTMVAHSCMYPDMRKGLDFLGSMYCGTQQYWKDMIAFRNIKEDS